MNAVNSITGGDIVPINPPERKKYSIKINYVASDSEIMETDINKPNPTSNFNGHNELYKSKGKLLIIKQNIDDSLVNIETTMSNENIQQGAAKTKKIQQRNKTNIQKQKREELKKQKLRLQKQLNIKNKLKKTKKKLEKETNEPFDKVIARKKSERDKEQWIELYINRMKQRMYTCETGHSLRYILRYNDRTYMTLTGSLQLAYDICDWYINVNIEKLHEECNSNINVLRCTRCQPAIKVEDNILVTTDNVPCNGSAFYISHRNLPFHRIACRQTKMHIKNKCLNCNFTYKDTKVEAAVYTLVSDLDRVPRLKNIYFLNIFSYSILKIDMLKVMKSSGQWKELYNCQSDISHNVNNDIDKQVIALGLPEKIENDTVISVDGAKWRLDINAITKRGGAKPARYLNVVTLKKSSSKLMALNRNVLHKCESGTRCECSFRKPVRNLREK